MKKRISLAVLTLCILFLSKSMGVKAAASPANISVNTFYSVQVISGENSKEYNFDLSAPGKVNITFNHPNISNTSSCWKIKIINQSEETLLEMYSSGIETTKTSGDVGLPAGHYYLQIEKWNSDADSVTCNFKVNHTTASNWESESNDGYGTADNIMLNTDYHGANQFSSDKDFYRFSLDAAGKININFVHPVLSNNNSYWRLCVYNTQAEELLSLYIRGTEEHVTTAELGLAAGNYYFLVETSYFNSSTYTFKVDYVQSDAWKRERNDGYDTADLITTGKSYFGAFQRDTDEDYYKFILNEKKDIEINFRHPTLDSGSVYWYVDLYNATAQKIVSSCVTGVDTNTTGPMVSLNAGTYYVVIKPARSSTVTYRLTVNYGKPLEKPTLAGSFMSGKWVKLTWSKSSKGNGYEIYRSDGRNNRFYKLKELSGRKVNTWTDIGVSLGKTYYYKIRSYLDYGEGRNYSPYSSVVKMKLSANTSENINAPAKAVIKKVTAGSGKATIIWKKQSGISGYQIYMSTKKNSGYKKIKTITKASATKYIKKGLKQKKRYYFKVRAYRKVSGKNVYGRYSAPKSVKIR